LSERDQSKSTNPSVIKLIPAIASKIPQELELVLVATRNCFEHAV